MDWLFIISFAIVLAAFTGIRAFLPITIIGIFSKLNIVPIDNFNYIPFINYITDDRVLAFLIISTIIEILSDKIPAVDNFLDGVYTFLKPVVSFISVYGIACFGFEPWQVAIISITMSLISLGVSTTKGAIRVASTTGSLGLANPFISILEDIFVTIKMILSILFSWLLPIISFLVIIGLIFITIWFFKVGRKVFNRKVFKERNVI